MKKLIWLLLFLPGIAVGQNKKIIKNLQTGDFYIKLEKPNGISVCGEASVNFYITTKIVYIDTYAKSFDLKIIKRKDIWVAQDKEGKYYYIFGTTFEGNSTIIIKPYDLTQPVFILSTINPCEN